MKRKASELDDFDGSPPRWFLNSSPQLFTATGMITPPPESTTQSSICTSQNNPWPSRSMPHFNLRTRKRHRDGRPDEETIHQNTLAKLFGAQRQETFERQQSPSSPTPRFNFVPSQSQSEFAVYPQDMQPPEIRVEPPPVERNQRSIESFFGVHATSRGKTPSYSEPPVTTFSRRVYPSSASSCRPHCEDCSTPLALDQTSVSNNDINMEISMGDDTEVSAAFTCAVCNRMVCDTCAVRGDYRVCLECAMPGSGSTTHAFLDFSQQQQSAMVLS